MNGRRMLKLLALVIAVAGLRLVVGRSADGSLTIELAHGAILGYRLSALLTAALAGAALGLAGLCMQVLLRNPLAAPSVLGVTSGASLGVSLAAVATANAWVAGSVVPAWLNMSIEAAAAVAGAIGALSLVWVIAVRRGGIDPISVVLAGVVLGAVLGAVAMGLQWALPPHSRADVSLWMMGRVPEVPSWPVVIVSAVAIATSLCAALGSSVAMDAAAAGENEARSMGVPMHSLRMRLLLAAGVLSGCAVALCGPIAFVGFVAPHLARGMVGPRARPLVVAAPLCGVIVLVGADACRLLVPTTQGRIPIGVVTACVGGLWFLRFIRRGREAWT